MDKPEQKQEQLDDHVQSSAMGAVKPLPEHPMGNNVRMPVSAATPDNEPKAERIQPPQHTGHDIGPNENVKPIEDGPYAKLPNRASDQKGHDEVMNENAQGAAQDDKAKVADKDHPMEVAPPLSNPPFPRATVGLPEQTSVGPANAATKQAHPGKA